MDSTRKLIACWAQPRVLRTIAENVRINVLSEFAGVGFAQKVDPIWNAPVSTGSAGALARRSVRSTFKLSLLDAVAVSRFGVPGGAAALGWSYRDAALDDFFDHAVQSAVDVSLCRRTPNQSPS